MPFGGIEFDPGSASRLLLVADETAVPAVASILEALPADAAGTAYLEVPVDADVQQLAAPPGVRVVWLPRNGAAPGERFCKAVLALFGLEVRVGSEPPVEVDPDLWETPTYSSSGEVVEPASEPTTDLYAWVAGESGAVTRLRRHLVRYAGLDRRQVAFMGYWRQGVAMRS
jgi:NADPH-dependent ferric siderophore reductase